MSISNILGAFVPKKEVDCKLKPPKLLLEALRDVLGDESHVNFSTLDDFWTKWQKEAKSMESIQEMEDGLTSCHEVKERDFPAPQNEPTPNGSPEFFSETVFSLFKMLLNPSITPAVETEVVQDMNAPLSHYFVYTGHNSYLKGNQLAGNCSIRPIIKSLIRGVRVIELDLWPNDKKKEVVVTHGGTLTKPVGFVECLIAVRDNAFKTSPYPVILTLEDHLTNELQSDAARKIREVLGDFLWAPPPNMPLAEYPSPEELKGKILVSTQLPKADKSIAKLGKRPKSSEEKILSPESSAERRSSTDQEAVKLSNVLGHLNPFRTNSADNKPSPSDALTIKVTRSPPAHSHSLPESFSNHSSNSSSSESDPEEIFESLTRSYRSLIAIAGGRMKGETPRMSLRESAEGVKRVSLSESQIASMAKTYPDDIIKFTQRNILRIYPTGMRVDSSNYKPMIGWTHGAQLVALNMQGYGSALWQVHGFFLGNGASGYVKKPDFLLREKERATVEEKTGDGEPLRFWNPKFPGPVRKILRVRVLQGTGWVETFGPNFYDRFSPPDFYVKIGISGVPMDKSSKKLSIKYNKASPNWEDELLEFSLTTPELALLKFKVMEHDSGGVDEFAGQVVLPVAFLKEGFRCVPLFGKKGWPLQPKIERGEKVDEADIASMYGSCRHLVNQAWQGPRLLCHFEIVGQ